MLLALSRCFTCRMCSTDVYCSKQTNGMVTRAITSFSSFLELGRRKLSMQPKFVAAQKMLLKRKLSANIRKWIARFLYFRHLYSAGSACVLLTNGMSCPSIWATPLLLINILLGSFQLFLHSSQPLSEGEIIPFSGVCQWGRLHYPRRRR